MMKKKLIAAIAALLACLMLMTGCASHGKTLIEAQGEEISVNVFQLYLSRMKGSLAEAGNSVTSDDYWNTYIDLSHTTTAEYYTAQVLEGLKHIAAAMILYEEYGLKLPDETVDEIDAWIDEVIETDGEGSKATLNSILSAYGANVTVLRDAALLEAKLSQLKEHLYGAGGSLIADTAIEEYYKATYYRGYQMQLANYYYDHEKDANGVAVRYTDDDFKKVAYVSKATLDGLSEEERAKYVTVAREGKYATTYGEAYGDTLTLYRDGDTEVVAYDKDNGVIKYSYDSKGNMIVKNYTEAEMQARYERAQSIATECVNDEAKFLVYASEFSDNSDFNATYAPNGMYFALGTYSADTAFGTFSSELARLEIGGTCVLASDSGYYILMRAELDTGAWQQEANARWFSTLRGLTLEYMLQQKTAAYLDRVTVDEELLKTVDITTVASNIRY
ncbi:MAG: hypothetical protein IJW51_05900 [Clostridia bacterium]|nr:hypothetical protein [Clostridia bacterium]